MQIMAMHKHPKDPFKLLWGARLEVGDTVKAGDFFADKEGWKEFTSLGHLIYEGDKTYWVRPDLR